MIRRVPSGSSWAAGECLFADVSLGMEGIEDKKVIVLIEFFQICWCNMLAEEIVKVMRESWGKSFP